MDVEKNDFQTLPNLCLGSDSEGEEEELRLLDNIPLGRDKVELPSIGIAPMSKF